MKKRTEHKGLGQSGPYSDIQNVFFDCQERLRAVNPSRRRKSLIDTVENDLMDSINRLAMVLVKFRHHRKQVEEGQEEG